MRRLGIGSGVCNIEFAGGSKLECSGTNAEFVKALGILELKSNRGEIVKLKYVPLPIYLRLTSNPKKGLTFSPPLSAHSLGGNFRNCTPAERTAVVAALCEMLKINKTLTSIK